MGSTDIKVPKGKFKVIIYVEDLDLESMEDFVHDGGTRDTKEDAVLLAKSIETSAFSRVVIYDDAGKIIPFK